MLDLFARTRKGEKVSVSNACLASGVPAATALRWVDLLVDNGLVTREADIVDRRRVWLKLTPKCIEQMQCYFENMIFMRDAEKLLAS